MKIEEADSEAGRKRYTAIEVKLYGFLGDAIFDGEVEQRGRRLIGDAYYRGFISPTYNPDDSIRARIFNQKGTIIGLVMRDGKIVCVSTETSNIDSCDPVVYLLNNSKKLKEEIYRAENFVEEFLSLRFGHLIT